MINVEDYDGFDLMWRNVKGFLWFVSFMIVFAIVKKVSVSFFYLFMIIIIINLIIIVTIILSSIYYLIIHLTYLFIYYIS